MINTTEFTGSRQARANQGQVAASALLLLVAASSAAAVTALGSSFDAATLERVGGGAPQSSTDGSLSDESNRLMATPTVGSSSQSALQFVRGLWRPLSDAAVSATKDFPRVDHLPVKGSPLFRTAQRTLVDQIQRQGYAIVDLRMSDALRLRLSQRGAAGADAELSNWFNQFANVPGELVLGMEPRKRGKRFVPPFEQRFEPSKKLGFYMWHTDGNAFTALLGTRGTSAQLAPRSALLPPEQVEAAYQYSLELIQQYGLEAAGVKRKLEAVDHYKKELTAIKPGLDESILRTAEEGSVMAEEGELMVFINPDALAVYSGLLHRRPAELFNQPEARVLWVGRGDTFDLNVPAK